MVLNEKEPRDFVNLLKACSQKKDLQKGSRLHADLLKRGLLENLHVASALVSMYAKCGELTTAVQVLDELPVRDVVTWSSLISEYAQQKLGGEALHSYEYMQCEGLCPDRVTLTSVLKACGCLGNMDKGKQIHEEIVQQEMLGKDVVLCNALVDMYVKCGWLVEAEQVFDALPVRDGFSWCALIAGYAQQGGGKKALNCFELMLCDGLYPDSVTFVCLLKACSSIRAIEKGRKIHYQVVHQGLFKKDIVLGTALVDMYAKCGMLTTAQQMFDELPLRSDVSWTALITGYMEQEKAANALGCFHWMQCEGVTPNKVTYACILKACGFLGLFNTGRQIHIEITTHGLVTKDVALGNALIDMYVKCGAVEKAARVFDDLAARDLVSWSALIAGYSQQGRGTEALSCFQHMYCEGLSPDVVTFACILKACGSIAAVDIGSQIHTEILNHGLLGRNVVLGTILVDMYAKCGAFLSARKVFDELLVRDAGPWCTLIAGYANFEQEQGALSCYGEMQHEGMLPDTVTFITILKICGNIGASNKGRQIHKEIVDQTLLGRDIVLGTALIAMYAKNGVLREAEHVLDKLPVRNIVTWNTLMSGYTHHVEVEKALNCYKLLQLEGFSPDAVTLTLVLNACSRSGLLHKGQGCLGDVSERYRVSLDTGHHTCMIDFLARSGYFDEALTLIAKLPLSNDPAVWSALLCACQKWGNVVLGQWAFGHALKSFENDASALSYVSASAC